jgi:long-chain acyl-CoA synthetase
MHTLLELLPCFSRHRSREAVAWSNGLRTWKWSYGNLLGSIGAFANWLDQRGFRKGDRLMIWGENRPEWLAAFWGAVVRGVAVVPVDFRFSPELAVRIQKESRPKLLVYGSSVEAGSLTADRIGFEEIANLPCIWPVRLAAVGADDTVEIVYTSGTTGEPRGVMHRHRNICANLVAFQREIDRYKALAFPFQPVRMLNLLPLSHMFGQSMGLFIPAVLGGSVVFTNELQSARIIRLAHDHRISVIVCVPRILGNLKSDVERRFKIAPQPSGQGWTAVVKRWWRYRDVHSHFGWKFWAFVVGGARLDPELEEFWSKLGFLVVQGYGLTEASPVVAVNHPFDAKRGSLGKVVPGQDVKIAADGEILVRGESVTSGHGEWLNTGDLGAIDEEGRLYYRGRKKELIVTSEGLNVHPEDVEAVLNKIPGVRESAVVGIRRDGSDVVHAALILTDPSVDAEFIVSKANEQLEAHQRIREWTLWPDDAFPRTPSTLKIKRHEVAARIADGLRPIGITTTGPAALESVLARGEAARLAEDLGLSSLERVELLSQLETKYGLEVDEDQFARVTTVGELKTLTRTAAPPAVQARISDWSSYRAVHWLGGFLQRSLVLPLFRRYIPLRVDGLRQLEGVRPPVIFAANHTSHLDTVAIVAALPRQWRRWIAPAMSTDYFRPWFHSRGFTRRESWKAGLQFLLARTVFNAYPLAQELGGVKRALEFTGELVSRGYCPLVYPEGQRTRDGKIHPFRQGIGLMAVRLQVPVLPIHIKGLYEVYSVHHDWPTSGPVRISFGEPLRFNAGTSYEDAARMVETAVHRLGGLSR